MLLQSDTLFRASQSLLFLHNDVVLAENQQISNFIVFCFTRPRLDPKIYKLQQYTTSSQVYVNKYK